MHILTPCCGTDVFCQRYLSVQAHLQCKCSPCKQSHALTIMYTLKIPSIGSPMIVWNRKIQYMLVQPSKAECASPSGMEIGNSRVHNLPLEKVVGKLETVLYAVYLLKNGYTASTKKKNAREDKAAVFSTLSGRGIGSGHICDSPLAK